MSLQKEILAVRWRRVVVKVFDDNSSTLFVVLGYGEISILGCFPFVLPSFRTISPDILTISLPFPGILPPYKVIGMANQDALPSIRVTLPSFQASRMGMPIK